MRTRIALLAVLAIAASRGDCGGSSRYDPCAGKACGDPCHVCAPDDGSCFETQELKACDPAGLCASAGSFACSPTEACEGKTCGDACDRCGGMCMGPAATACDYAGRCVPRWPWICYDPCAGKACGETCHVCPPDAQDCFEVALVMVCDGGGVCVPETPGLVCP